MRAGLISTFLLLFTSIIAHSQDIYLLKYKSPNTNDKTTYDAFFSVSPNGTGIVRIKPVNNKNVTVEMTFQEEYAMDKEGMPDTTKMVCRAMDPKVVKGDWNINIVPVTFWFKINKDNFFDPWAVTNISEKLAPSEKNLLSAELIKTPDLAKNKDLVASFFADTSAYYKNIFVKSRGGMLSSEEKRNTHMYLVIVASTGDESLKPNCANDAQKVINMFKEISTDVLELPETTNFHLTTIYEKNYSRANVETALKKLPTTNKNNNLVIFYYSGHGFTDKKNSPGKVYPFFDLRDPTKQKFYKDLETQTLNVQDIYDTIIKKGNRFNLVLSDCCNDTVAAPKKPGLKPPGHKGTSKVNFDNVKTLFMNKKPVNLLMTAASIDEEAVVTPSIDSYFTYFFLQSLATYISPEKGFPTWRQILEATKNQTSKQVCGLPCKANVPCEERKRINCPKQTPKILTPGIK